jgi:hypothetical protein
MELPVVIPSHKRAGRVTTHRTVTGALVCVPESQRDDYAKHHPANTLLLHPDSVKGISAKRQWIYEKFPEVFMLDDDVIACQRIWRPAGRKGIAATLRPEEVRDLIEVTAATARELGARLFGFNSHCAPMTYNGWRPFRFGGYTPGGAFGLLRSDKLYFPNTTLPVEDWWICLLNAYHHRFAWFDCRFAFGFKDTYTGVGGCAELRVDDGEKKAFDYLKRHFGAAVQRKTANANRNRQTTKRERNTAPRTMVIPWPH